MNNNIETIPVNEGAIFEDKSIVIRKLTQAGYRLLNFILYSHLFFQTSFLIHLLNFLN